MTGCYTPDSMVAKKSGIEGLGQDIFMTCHAMVTGLAGYRKALVSMHWNISLLLTQAGIETAPLAF